MGNAQKNSHLFYGIVALFFLGFVASLAFPINGQGRNMREADRFGGHFVPATGSSAPATENSAAQSRHDSLAL